MAEERLTLIENIVQTVTLQALLAAGLVTCGTATASGRGTPMPVPPLIMKTAVDVQKNHIVITGRNFGTTPPTVTLADQVLDVQHFSEHEVVANLPSRLTAATYGVTVTVRSGRNSAHSNPFSATLPDIDNK